MLGALSVLSVTLTAEAVDKGTASGSFEYNEKKYTAAYAVAWHEGPLLKVGLSDKPFDPALGQDGVYTESDLMAHPSASLRIIIDSERRQLVGIRLRDDHGSGADFRCEDPGLLTLKKLDAATVAGTFQCQEYNVTFEASILPAAKP